MKVGIVGAGPAGLTLAHALLTLPGPNRVSVSVFDRSDDPLRPALGGGLQLTCGARALESLGIDVSSAASPLRSVVSRRASDRSELLRLDVRSAMREAGAPTVGAARTDTAFAIMRDDLQRLLAERLPAGTLQLGRRVALAYPRGGGGARLVFGDSTSEDVDLLVGCDGISSEVKRSFFADQPPPSYSGVRIAFGVAPAGSRPAGSEAEFHQWLGDGVYALSASYGDPSASGAAGNDMLAVCYADADAGAENAGWAGCESLRADCDARLRAAAMPAEVLELNQAASRYYETAVYFRNPSFSWASACGSAALCGDAAHAMPPFLGQGANQAILDAHRLGSCLREVGGEHASVSDALRAYQNGRWFPTSRLLANSRLLGFLETQRGLGASFRDAFFFTTGRLGVAKRVFLDGAMMEP